jgi:hypothetical protein
LGWNGNSAAKVVHFRQYFANQGRASKSEPGIINLAILGSAIKTGTLAYELMSLLARQIQLNLAARNGCAIRIIRRGPREHHLERISQIRSDGG